MNKENIDVPLDTQPPEEEDKKPKSRKKKAASSDEEMTKVPKEIIDEINRVNSNIEMLKNATGRKEEKKPKSIDEIVKDASEDKPNEKKADKSESFTVSKEAMESGVNDYKLPSVELLSLPNKKSTADISGELKENAQRLIKRFAHLMLMQLLPIYHEALRLQDMSLSLRQVCVFLKLQILLMI